MTAVAEERRVSTAVTKPLERLTSVDLNDIAEQVGAQVSVLIVDGQGLLRRASLNHLGSVISIDAQHHRRPGVNGPFLTVSSESATQSDPPLRNPSVEIAPGLVSFTTSEYQDGRSVDRLVQVSREGLLQTTLTRRG